MGKVQVEEGKAIPARDRPRALGATPGTVFVATLGGYFRGEATADLARMEEGRSAYPGDEWGGLTPTANNPQTE